MTEQETKEHFLRFVVEHDNGKWEFKKIPKSEVAAWMNNNPKAKLIRYALATTGGNLFFDSKEEAAENGKDPKPAKLPDELRDKIPNDIYEKIFTEQASPAT